MLFLTAFTYLILGICGAVCAMLLRKSHPPDKTSKAVVKTPSQCYDRALRQLAEEQGDWYVNVILERELGKLYRFYSHHESEITAGKLADRRFDDDEDFDIEESEESSSSESESTESSNDEESETEDRAHVVSRKNKTASSARRPNPPPKPSSDKEHSKSPEPAGTPSITRSSPARTRKARAERRKKRSHEARANPVQAAPTEGAATPAAAVSDTSPAKPPAAADTLPAKPLAPTVPPRAADWQKYLEASLAEDVWIQAGADYTRATGNMLEVIPPDHRL
jgi:hypothetical protein